MAARVGTNPWARSSTAGAFAGLVELFQKQTTFGHDAFSRKQPVEHLDFAVVLRTGPDFAPQEFDAPLLDKDLMLLSHQKNRDGGNSSTSPPPPSIRGQDNRNEHLGLQTTVRIINA